MTFHRAAGVVQLNAYVLVEENQNHVYHSTVHIDGFVLTSQTMFQYDCDNLFVADFDYHIPLCRKNK